MPIRLDTLGLSAFIKGIGLVKGVSDKGCMYH